MVIGASTPPVPTLLGPLPRRVAGTAQAPYDHRQYLGEAPLEREQRRLAAIVAADVVGYSRLMGRDESGTVARLCRVRAERLEPIVARRGGRVVKLTGDGAPVDAVAPSRSLSLPPAKPSIAVLPVPQPQRRSRAGLSSALSCHSIIRSEGWSHDPAATLAEIKRLATAVARMGQPDALALSIAGHAMGWVAGDWDAAAALIDRAMAANPNLPLAWSEQAMISLAHGRHSDALEQGRKAIGLSPQDPRQWFSKMLMAFALLLLDRPDQALSVAGLPE